VYDVFQEASMHDVDSGMLVISVEGVESDDENERLREVARSSGAAGHVRDARGRCPDLVLSDHMDNELAALDEFNRYAEQKRYEAGFGHDKGLAELGQLQSMLGGDADSLRDGLAGKLEGAQRDMDEYAKFNGDVVAMELSREGRGDLTIDDDGLLSVMSNTGRSYEEMSDVEEALAAMREELGESAAAELKEVSDGVVVLMVATPHGESVYGYDVRSGVGRFS
jgi:hypothetical protein